jgi:hypothetical protein
MFDTDRKCDYWSRQQRNFLEPVVRRAGQAFASKPLTLCLQADIGRALARSDDVKPGTALRVLHGIHFGCSEAARRSNRKTDSLAIDRRSTSAAYLKRSCSTKAIAHDLE